MRPDFVLPGYHQVDLLLHKFVILGVVLPLLVPYTLGVVRMSHMSNRVLLSQQCNICGVIPGPGSLEIGSVDAHSFAVLALSVLGGQLILTFAWSSQHQLVLPSALRLLSLLALEHRLQEVALAEVEVPSGCAGKITPIFWAPCAAQEEQSG